MWMASCALETTFNCDEFPLPPGCAPEIRARGKLLVYPVFGSHYIRQTALQPTACRDSFAANSFENTRHRKVSYVTHQHLICISIGSVCFIYYISLSIICYLFSNDCLCSHICLTFSKNVPKCFPCVFQHVPKIYNI